MMKSTLILMWNTEVDYWCFGDMWAKMAQGTWSKLMARWMQHVIRKYLWQICVHQAWSFTWVILGHSNITVIQNTRPSQPIICYSRGKERVLEQPSQSSDLKIIEQLWGYLKHAVHARQHKNLQALEAFCLEK